MLTDMVPSLWHEPLNLKDLIDNDIDISVGSFFTLDRIVSIANGCDKSVRIQVKLEVQSGRDGFCLGDKSRLRSVRAMKNVRSLF